jgi:hypothetical protein
MFTKDNVNAEAIFHQELKILTNVSLPRQRLAFMMHYFPLSTLLCAS